MNVEISADAQGTLTDPVLAVVVDSATSEVHYYDLSPQIPELVAGDATTVIDLDVGANIDSAAIEFLVDGQYAERNPVIVW